MRAYKCDDCGKLESGIATTVTGDGGRTVRMLVLTWRTSRANFWMLYWFVSV